MLPKVGEKRLYGQYGICFFVYWVCLYVLVGVNQKHILFLFYNKKFANAPLMVKNILMKITNIFKFSRSYFFLYKNTSSFESCYMFETLNKQ